ncbi:MAG: RES family NAD+ phosphorylase, partial [Planctomycetes bacterium]|nr:RES family NAD+ phosphorylase [Planctomycetota bacterium]
PADWDVLAEIESLTNPRARDELGDIQLVPVEQRVAGPGATWVMAPFAHRRPSRFSDGSHGVYYAAHDRGTAVAETRYHIGRFYLATREPPLDLEMRVLAGALDGRFHDLRGDRRRWSAVLDPDSYAAANAFGAELRAGGSRGIVYPSVRDPGGQCLGAFRPDAVGLPESIGVLGYRWNGREIAGVFDYDTGEWLAD